MKTPPAILCLLSALCLPVQALPEPKGEVVVFDITTDVVADNPPRFGANIEPPAMSHWNTEPWHNQWWLAPNINPFTARTRGVATGGGDDFLEHDDGWKLGFYDVFRDGFFDGGRCVVYRIEDNRASLLRDGTIKRFLASNHGPNRLEFTTPGAAIQKGDYYFLTVERTDIPPGTTRTYEENPLSLLGGFAANPHREKPLFAAGLRAELAADAAPGNGRSSLKITAPPGLPQTPFFGNWLIDGSHSDWPRFREGAAYTVRLWLKQAGMAAGNVEVRVGNLHSQSIAVGDNWKEFSFGFTGGPPSGAGAERFEIGLPDPGTLWIDNVTITEDNGPPPFGFYPHIVDTLKRFRPGSLRLWTLQENRGFGKGLDDALGPPALSNLTFSETGGASTTTPLGLHKELELCAEVGTIPWIITSVMFSPQENQNLIEYLAGPPDSPYGKKRAEWGRVAPWTEAFEQILIEPGNEVWNGMFAPQAFSGKPGDYGAYAEFIFQTMKSSPWFKNDDFFFVVNGWSADTGPRGFGARALVAAPSADAFDIAYYTGGWDSVGLLKADNEEEGWMNVLTFSRRMLLHRSELAVETAKAIGDARGRPASVLVYEAGPGYTLPGPGKFDIEEQRQGKSMAHAVNALDIFMSNLRIGIGQQSFFLFKNGHYWASHNRQWGEHIAWKALGMRNRLLEGDLITAIPIKMVAIDLPETEAEILSQTNSADRRIRSFPPIPDLPLVDCHPFQNGKHFAFMLLSRRLDGPTRVTLNLPYDPESAYTLHTLAADSPAAHNIDAEEVKIITEEKSGMTRSFSINVPPHSVVVLVNHAK